MDNREIFNEMFFKKASYEDNLKKRMPQYTPVSKTPENAFQVSDTEEVKKRLAGTFGIAFGNNNVKNLASRALKTFPILISDNVDAQTAIMLKKLVEEQYAEYINLMISNQVVNLADYRTGGEDGNIALQAVDNLSGTDFTKSRIANTAARTKKIDSDTIFANVPIYQLLKENKDMIPVDDSILKSLFENVCIIPSEYENDLVDFMLSEADDIAEINEAYTIDRLSGSLYDYRRSDGRSKLAATPASFNNVSATIAASDRATDLARGFHGTDSTGREIYSKISSGDIVLDQNRFNAAVNRTVGELLSDPENAIIKDKFEKATFLLQSRKISGMEYNNYLTIRLGIPVSDEARQLLVRKFKTADVRKAGMDNSGSFTLTADEITAISRNEADTRRVVAAITRVKFSDVLTGVGVGVATGSTAAGVGAIIAGATFTSIFWPALIGCAVGSGVYALVKFLKRKKNLPSINKIEGWERVEKLIEIMEKNRDEVINGSKQKEGFNKDLKDINIGSNVADFEKLNNAINSSSKLVNSFLTESASFQGLHFNSYKETLEEGKAANEDELMAISEELAQDKLFATEFLTEGLLDKAKEMKLKLFKKAETKNKDAIVVPSFMTAAQYAYGSTEIERKDNKDRKYNQPLIMTVRFKERFASDKSADNELTAVIGILGKIIRIPSEEMEYILSENTKGNTIEGIFKGSEDLSNAVSDMLGTSKIAAEAKNLPNSGEIWHNLEKVATLAAANEISGRRNNNIANAHIIFSQKEIDTVRHETGVDYLRDMKKTAALMRRYSAFTLMIANDAGQRVSIFDDPDNTSWDVVPYSAVMGKDSGDQLNAMLNKMMRL